jgi:hypothetical protein
LLVPLAKIKDQLNIMFLSMKAKISGPLGKFLATTQAVD